MTYEELLVEADNNNLITKEKNLVSSNGRIKGNRIAIRKDIPTLKKHCVLAEELGHYFTTVGNIVELKSESDVKQEHKARVWAYDKLIGIPGFINCFKAHRSTIYECAEYLDITEEFLYDAITYYKQKYGLCARCGQYIIYFEPTLAVVKMV